MKDSLRKYIEARRGLRLNSEVMDSEAERIYSCFRDYVISVNDGRAHKFSEVLADFYSDMLFLEDRDRTVKSSLTRRFRKLSRKYNVSNPKYQKTLDDSQLW